jgi:hypothetical protein
LLLGTKQWITENMRGIKKVLKSQENTHNMVEVQANSESRSLTSSPTRSPRPPCLQIDVQDAYDLRFGPTKIGVDRNHQNKIDFQNLLGVAPPISG